MAAQAEGSPREKRFARSATDSIWLGPTQQSGVSHLCAEMQVRALIGPSSCGKTTLLQHFRHHLDDTLTLHITEPLTSGSEVLTALLAAASLEVTDLTDDEQRKLLKVFIEQRRLLGTRVIVCVDQVSGFSEEAWSEIERLLTLKVSNKTLVELAVVGTRDEAANFPLSKTVERGTTSAVEAVRYLAAPDHDDIRRYITWQLARIGLDTNFSPEACLRIAELSENRFAAVNDLCDTIISSPTCNRAKSIDADAVERAAGRLTAPEATVTSPALSLEEVLPDRLVISRNGQIEQVIPLDGRLVIGRSPSTDLRLADAMISRHHALLVPSDDGRFTIVDLNSSNGVLVNGRRIRRHILRSGDTVQMSPYDFKLLAASRASKAAAPDTDRTTTKDRPQRIRAHAH